MGRRQARCVSARRCMHRHLGGAAGSGANMRARRVGRAHRLTPPRPILRHSVVAALLLGLRLRFRSCAPMSRTTRRARTEMTKTTPSAIESQPGPVGGQAAPRSLRSALARRTITRCWSARLWSPAEFSVGARPWCARRRVQLLHSIPDEPRSATGDIRPSNGATTRAQRNVWWRTHRTTVRRMTACVQRVGRDGRPVAGS